MPLHPNRRLPVKGAFNLRDLGGYPLQDGGETKWGRALRADGLSRLTEADIALLRDRGLKRVVDLRAHSEVERHPGRLTGVPGIEVLNIPVYDQLEPLSALPAGDPLPGFYHAMLTGRREVIARIFAALEAEKDGTVLFHCTAGKDRTGLIAALWLALAGVEREAILQDYALTEALIPDLIVLFNKDLEAKGIDPELVRPMLACNQDYMAGILDFIEDDYGDVTGYLSACGLCPGQLSSLRSRLTA